MDLRPLFELSELAILTLSAYWGLKIAADTLTYIKLRGVTLLFPLLLAVIFKKAGFVPTFLLILAFFTVKRVGARLALVTSIFALMVFLIGAMLGTIGLGVLGTAFHVPGYEMHGTLKELLHQATVRGR